MSQRRSSIECMPVRPSDLSRCASWFSAQVRRSRSLRHCARAAAKKFDWPTDYAEAVSMRLLAWGRYLELRRRVDAVPDILTLVAAAATPLTDERGFDADLLEQVAREYAVRMTAFNHSTA
jgi:hypothetical protein